MLKFISENKPKIFAKNNQNLLTFFCCVFIFLLSIYLRSMLDIGGDSAVYLDLVAKISAGGKYYYDFFEGNFPLSFYLYLIPQYFAAKAGISPIITAEVFVNFLGIVTIFFSSKILRGSRLTQIHQNILTIAFTLGFFLRIDALDMNEFITKTTFFLICSFIYISFSFPRKNALSTKELICRGLSAALLSCLKPHYIILPVIIEFHRFLQEKSPRFFIKIDKLVIYFTGIIYLFLMLKFTPEFFEFILPMWASIHYPYNNFHPFSDVNILDHLHSKIIFFSAIFLIFLRRKFLEEDKILALVFIAASLILLAEVIGSFDQKAGFFGLITIVIAKIFYDFVKSQDFDFGKNKLPLIFLTIWAFYDAKEVIAMRSWIMFWWAIIPAVSLILCYKIQRKRILLYALPAFIILLLCGLKIAQYNQEIFLCFSVLVFLIFIFLHEKIYGKFYHKFSPFFVFIQFFLLINLSAQYLFSIWQAYSGSNIWKTPNFLSDNIISFSKAHLAENSSKGEKILIISDIISNTFPAVNYLEKPNNFIGNSAGILFWNIANDYSGLKNKEAAASTVDYIFRDFKKRVSDKETKIIFINRNLDFTSKEDRCQIGLLENYFSDREFRNIFLQNYKFVGRIRNKVYDFEIYLKKK